MQMRRIILVAIAMVLGLWSAVDARGQEVIAPAFAGSYSLRNIGTPPGVPLPLGGIAFLDSNTLLVP